MIKYQDVNIAIVERENVVEGEDKYLVIGKTYAYINLNDAMDIMIHVFNEDTFYVNNILSKGLECDSFRIGGEDFENDVHKITNHVLLEKLRQEFLEVIRENPNWIDNSNLTAEEKKTLKGVL